jgi:hypothetical protein
MTNDTTAQQVADLLSTPMEQMLVALGAGIGQAQVELDRHSIEIQKQILEDPLLSQYGLEATWYQIPKTDLELKIAIAMEKQEQSVPIGGVKPKPVLRIWAQPMNARYTNQFSFDLQAASTLKLSVVAVPPPGVASSKPNLEESEALQAAKSHLFLDSQGNLEPRVSVNFNGGARAWYIIQTSEKEDEVATRAFVKVDDDTGNVVKFTGGPGT